MSKDNLPQLQVSGWEDDLNDIEEEQNPHETPAKEILWATEKQKIELVRTLLKSDPNLVHSTDSDGYTPLHRASYNNNVDLIELLLSYNANVEAKTEYDWTPLHSACQWNNVDCVIKLLQYGADINARTNGGQTPLHIAASHGASYETVQVLLSNPYIKPELLSDTNETAYEIAKRSSKYYNIFEMASPFIKGIE